MSIESDYIYSLEKRISDIENSKGYRWTRSISKICNIITNAINILKAIPCLLNKARRNRYDRVNYPRFINELCHVSYNSIHRIDSKDRDKLVNIPIPISGFWLKYPWLHYCIFNRNISLDINIRSGDAYDQIDPHKETVILVTHDTSRTGAPILVYDLLKRFIETHNVIVFSISKGAISDTFRNEATVFIEPISRSHITEILTPELDSIKLKSKNVFAVVNSIVSTEILKDLWAKDIPSLHLVHEFASYTRPRSSFEDSYFYSDAMIFSANIVLANAISSCPAISNSKEYVIPQGVCPTPNNEMSDEEKNVEIKYIKSALRPKGWPEDTIVVLGAGSVHLRKGVDLFVTCAKKVIAQNPERKIRFVWIGAGFEPETDLYYSCFLDDQINRAELGDSFSIITDVNEFDSVYGLADIFFLSSRLDPLPLVAQGALFHKLPLVCFDSTGGIPEYLHQDNVAAESIVPFLDIESAALKITNIINNKEASKKVSEAGQILAKEIFDQDRYFATLKKIHEEIISERKKETEDISYIVKYKLCDISYSYPQFIKNPLLAAKHYIRSWRKGIRVRKPFPGFHPGIYKDFHTECSNDPLVNYHMTGSRDGPWKSEVISPPETESQTIKITNVKAALHIHLHYSEMAVEIFSRLKDSEVNPDLFISVTSEDGKIDVEKELQAYSLLCKEIKIVPNRGRDIGPLLTGYREIFGSDYDFVGHVHGKKSVTLGGNTGSAWAVFLYENLLGGKCKMMDLILGNMARDTTLGLVFPDDPHAMGWNKNRDHAVTLANKMSLNIEIPISSLNFPVGTMFWCRPDALKPLIDLNLAWSDYPEEPVPYDGSALHAVERLLPLVTKNQGYRYAVTHVPNITR